MELRSKDLLGIESLSKEEILLILDQADSFKEISTREIKKVPALRGKTIIFFFVEASTRTRTSFEIAAKRLSADTLSITASASSLTKGETLLDTAKNLEAMAPDAIIIRHAYSGAPHFLANLLKASIINAGDGTHEHPTQALLDAFTIREKKRRLEGLRIAIIGDILHSRVVRSNVHLLTKCGADVIVSGPAPYLPPEFAKLGVKVTHDIRKAVDAADVIMMLRIQLERQDRVPFPSMREYFRFFGLDRAKLKFAKPDCIIMHPGPINRGVEIDSEVADGPYSVILDQVTNGVAVRMAVLYLTIGGGHEEATA
jgi:aspartate carbamoyltransferase catalytic subunit